MSELYRINKATLQDIGAALKDVKNTDASVRVGAISDDIRGLKGTATSDKVFVGETYLGANGVSQGTFTIEEELTEQGTALDDIEEMLEAKLGNYPIEKENKLVQIAERALVELTEEDLNGATQIVSGPFSYNSNLVKVEIPSSVTTIHNNAFQNCSNLTILSLKDGLASIGSNAFDGAKSLASITFPSTLLSVGSNAFRQSGIEDLVLPSTGIKFGKYVFNASPKLKRVFIPNNIDKISVADSGYLFATCSSLTDVTLEEGLTDTFGGMFYNCQGLANITLPVSLKKLSIYEFAYCKALKSIDLSHITEIGEGALRDTGLTSIILSEALTSIGNDAFRSCPYLPEIAIPSNVTEIGSNAFNYCSALKKVIVKAITPPSIQSNTFSSGPADRVYEVPAESVDAYKAATNWSTLADQIFAIEEE